MKPWLMIIPLALFCSTGLTQQPAAQKTEKKTERSAAAGGTLADASILFRRLDRNRDGYLSEQELWSELGERSAWAAMDTDGDGRISPAEFVVMR